MKLGESLSSSLYSVPSCGFCPSCCRCELAQFLVFNRSARHADAFAGEVGKAFDGRGYGRKYRLKEGRVSRCEVDDFFTLWIFAEGRNDEVCLACLQVRHAVGAGHGRQFNGDTHFGSDVIGHVHVQTLRFQVGADKTAGRKVRRNGNGNFLAFMTSSSAVCAWATTLVIRAAVAKPMDRKRWLGFITRLPGKSNRRWKDVV